MIRVLVADDHAAVRGGFAALIAAEDEMAVAGEATNGREAVDLARSVFPHVVLMDIRMPLLDGLEATRLICSDPTLTDTRVLVLTTFDLDEYVYKALRVGASGFLLKDAGPRELLNAIRVVATGDALIAPSITKRLVAEFAARRDPTEPPAAAAELTEREREILRLVARGLSKRGDRRPARDQPHDHEDPRQPHPPQARLPRPRPTRHPRLRKRPRHPGRRGREKGATGSNAPSKSRRRRRSA